MLNIPSNQTCKVSSTRLAIYNSKSFKPNRLASLFKRKLRYVQELLARAPTKPIQWLDLLLVAVPAKIFMTAKTSLLAEFLPRVVIVIPLLSTHYILPFLLLYWHLLLLCLLFWAPPISMWLDTQKMTSCGLSRPFLRPDLFFLRLLHLFWLLLLPPLRIIKTHVNNL